MACHAAGRSQVPAYSRRPYCAHQLEGRQDSSLGRTVPDSILRLNTRDIQILFYLIKQKVFSVYKLIITYCYENFGRYCRYLPIIFTSNIRRYIKFSRQHYCNLLPTKLSTHLNVCDQTPPKRLERSTDCYDLRL